MQVSHQPILERWSFLLILKTEEKSSVFFFIYWNWAFTKGKYDMFKNEFEPFDFLWYNFSLLYFYHSLFNLIYIFIFLLQPGLEQQTLQYRTYYHLFWCLFVVENQLVSLQLLVVLLCHSPYCSLHLRSNIFKYSSGKKFYLNLQ